MKGIKKILVSLVTVAMLLCVGTVNVFAEETVKVDIIYNLNGKEIHRGTYSNVVVEKINEYGKDFSTLMCDGKITNKNCPVSYNLRKNTKCDYKCKECWDNIVDKLKED